MKTNKFSFAARFKSFAFAIKGIRTMFREEHNARIHSIAAILAIGLGFLLEIEMMEWLWIILCIAIVFTAELFNTALENLVDHISTEHHPRLGKVKDMAAGAVLISAIAAAIIGGIIFIPKLIELWANYSISQSMSN